MMTNIKEQALSHVKYQDSIIIINLIHFTVFKTSIFILLMYLILIVKY